MPPFVRSLLGAFTALMFTVAGLTMLAQGLQTGDNGPTAIGVALLGLAVFRAYVLVKQHFASREDGDEEPS